jgi:hypothetical protein
MERRVMLAVVLGAAVWAAAAPAVRAASAGPLAQEKTPPKVVFDIPPLSERIEIDGRKNPEMIPQWDAWQAVFEIIAKVSDLPTDVLEHLSKEEAALVLAAARENGQNSLACQQRVLKLMPTLHAQEAMYINDRTREINLECRWQTLRLRDRVLAALAPPGQAALGQYVEATKAGIRVFVPRNELAFYRQPQ